MIPVMMIPTMTLSRFIYSEESKHRHSTGELSDLLNSIAVGIKMITKLVATSGFRGLEGYTGNINVQGEETTKLDDEADAILVEVLGSSRHFGLLVSEERDGEIETKIDDDTAKYVVAFDPLDGSSNIGSNIPVGTIFTIFEKKDPSRAANRNDFLQVGRRVVASGYSVYGAKTSFVYSCGDGAHGFTLDPMIGEFVLTEENIKMPERGKYYSTNEGYTNVWLKETKSYIDLLKSENQEMGLPLGTRYVGSLVADFDRTLRKGGVFLHPATTKRSRGKLRLLYECIPLAFIAEQAGGMAMDGEKDILDIQPEALHDRCPFIVGSKWEMDLYRKKFCGS
ncbi:MAG: class 1 fructose-bisphosphatase [Bdellovibrionales bacterium]|nr:class 1 fructose-bisphosphatase [Bdellovibrionales bacterium]